MADGEESTYWIYGSLIKRARSWEGDDLGGLEGTEGGSWGGYDQDVYMKLSKNQSVKAVCHIACSRSAWDTKYYFSKTKQTPKQYTSPPKTPKTCFVFVFSNIYWFYN